MSGFGVIFPPATFPSSVSQLISRVVADVNVRFVGMQFLSIDPVNSDLILDRAMLIFVFFWLGAKVIISLTVLLVFFVCFVNFA